MWRVNKLLILLILGVGATAIITASASSSSSSLNEVSEKEKQGVLDIFVYIFLVQSVAPLVAQFNDIFGQISFAVTQIFDQNNYGDNTEPTTLLGNQMVEFANENINSSLAQQTLDTFAQLNTSLLANGVDEAATLFRENLEPLTSALQNLNDEVGDDQSYGTYVFGTVQAFLQNYAMSLGNTDDYELGISPVIIQFVTTVYEFSQSLGTNDFLEKLKPYAVQAAPHMERAWDRLAIILVELFEEIRFVWTKEVELIVELFEVTEANAGPQALPYFPILRIQLAELRAFFVRIIAGFDLSVSLAYQFVRRTLLAMIPLATQLFSLPQIWSGVGEILQYLGDNIEWDNDEFLAEGGNGDDYVFETTSAIQIVINQPDLIDIILASIGNKQK
jgi:hypothetical protein